MKAVPTSTTVEMVSSIWRRVLQQQSVGTEDNFFDLGGDSSLALELFNEIAKVTGRDLPPVMIYQAPTIAALANILEQPTTPRVPALMQLKTGTQQPPVFITHGLGGSVMDFYQVVKHIQTPRAIYGMQAKGIDGAEPPLDRIEDMARYSIEAVKQVQPHGPYMLVGFSLGGLVTLEMAQELIANGEEVAMLAMLDAYPHIGHLRFGQRARLVARQSWRRSLAWLGLKSDSSVQTVVDASHSPILQRFRDSAYFALERYQPKFYPGKISFVRAAIPTDFPADATAVWAHLAREFELETVPGDHLGIMTTHFESLASAISRFVAETPC